MFLKSLQGLTNRDSLRGQMYVRLLLVFLVTVIAVAIAATVNFNAQNKSNTALREKSLQHFYSASINRLEERWTQDASAIKHEIEFLGVLNNPGESEWKRLIAYLSLRGHHHEHDTVFIYAGETLLFAYGHEANEEAARNALKTTQAWYVSPEFHEIHRVFEVSVWLGKAGQGKLVFLRPISPALLTEMQAPNSHLSVALGSVKTESQVSVVDENNATVLSLPWGNLKNAPTMRVSHSPLTQSSLTQFMRQPAVVLVVIGLMLWWLLGTWLNIVSRRIAALRTACDSFPQHGIDANVEASLLNARLQNNDELGSVSQALKSMMQSIVIKNRAAKAHMDTLEALDEAVLEFDAHMRVINCSGAWLRLTRQERNDGDFLPYFHTEDRLMLADALEGLRRGEKHQISARVRMQRSNGEESWLECRLLALDGGIRAILRDVTQSYLQEKRITHMALHDSLTGLPNRVLFEDRVKISMRMAERTQKHVGLCFIDLDHFKHINDSLGHKVGDRLLVEFSNQVRKALRQGDTLARWGGDEFVLLLPDMPEESAIKEVTSKILRMTQQPVRIDGQEFNITFSMGVAVFPDNAVDTDSLMSQADRAMFYSKAQGRNTTTFYSDIADKGVGKKDLYIQNRLITAIKQDRIHAWFQPVVDAKTHRVVGVEALARWHEEGVGWVPPATFIPMAESLGLIRELGDKIWRDTLEAGRAWQKQGHTLNLAVNVSKRQLFMPYLTEKLLEDAENAGIKPQSIILEVTESVALLDVEYAAERLQELSNAGFRLALDDFGTGYSSLSQLHDMPVDELKIDISFVRRIHDPQGARLLQAIVQMTDALKIDTVAEGVEDAQTAQLLASYGVHQLQGYHFAKPMPREELDAWLKTQAAP